MSFLLCLFLLRHYIITYLLLLYELNIHVCSGTLCCLFNIICHFCWMAYCINHSHILACTHDRSDRQYWPTHTIDSDRQYWIAHTIDSDRQYWTAHMIDSDRQYWPDKLMIYRVHKCWMLALSQIATCTQYLSALPGLDRTNSEWFVKFHACYDYVNMSLEMVTLFWLDSPNIVMFWDMMLAARTADSVLLSDSSCSRSLQINWCLAANIHCVIVVLKIISCGYASLQYPVLIFSTVRT